MQNAKCHNWDMESAFWFLMRYDNKRVQESEKCLRKRKKLLRWVLRDEYNILGGGIGKNISRMRESNLQTNIQ